MVKGNIQVTMKFAKQKLSIFGRNLMKADLKFIHARAQEK